MTFTILSHLLLDSFVVSEEPYAYVFDIAYLTTPWSSAAERITT